MNRLVPLILTAVTLLMFAPTVFARPASAATAAIGLDEGSAGLRFWLCPSDGSLISFVDVRRAPCTLVELSQVGAVSGASLIALTITARRP